MQCGLESATVLSAHAIGGHLLHLPHSLCVIKTSFREQVRNDRYMIAKASYELIVKCEAGSDIAG